MFGPGHRTACWKIDTTRCVQQLFWSWRFYKELFSSSVSKKLFYAAFMRGGMPPASNTTT
jgi:hypothetical protein